mgnify:FL=1
MSSQESQPIYGIYKNQDVMIPMRDGIRLATDIYRPSDGYGSPIKNKIPVILVRTSYDKISNLFKRGHKLKLDISSSNFPRFDPNPNTGQAMGKHTSLIKAMNTVWMGGGYASKIKIPVVRNP